MSVEIMSQCWKLDLPQNKKLVLLAIADHANDEGIAWPSQGRIAWKTGYKRRNIKYILDSLVEDGYLTILRIGNGRKNSTVHQLTLENAPRLPEYNADDYYVPFKERVQPDVKGATGGKRVQPVVEKGAIAVAPEPSLEPSIEPSIHSNEEKASSLPSGKASLPEPPAKTKTPRKKKSDTDPRVKPLLVEFEKLVGYPLPNYKQEGTAAKLMLKTYQPKDILACWKYMQKDNDFWKDKHCGLSSVNKQIGKWLEGQNTNGGRIISL